VVVVFWLLLLLVFVLVVMLDQFPEIPNFACGWEV
jgi:hypothetical protein